MKSKQSHRPRYNHLLEVLDGAAGLQMAIRNAEFALMEPDLTGDERTMLESVLDASMAKRERVVAILGEKSEPLPDLVTHLDVDHVWSEQDLLRAGRAADEGSEEAEREANLAINRFGRELNLAARATIEMFLTHSSPLLRASAIKVLALHWHLTEFTDRALWMLVSDTEPECRRAAALALGGLNEGTRHPEVGRELVFTLRREYEEPDVRWASYYALLVVHGARPDERPLPIKDFEWLDDSVDEKIVGEYI